MLLSRWGRIMEFLALVSYLFAGGLTGLLAGLFGLGGGVVLVPLFYLSFPHLGIATAFLPPDTGCSVIRASPDASPRSRRRRRDCTAHSSEVLVDKLENVYRRAVVDHQFNAAARAVDLQARIRGFTGAIALAAGAGEYAECADWPEGRTANGGRGPRPSACGDPRRTHRGGAGAEEF